MFPDELKIAKVIPLFKSGDDSKCQNYRPVSVLPSFSKIFEKIIYSRLLSFIDKHDIIYKYQFGFRQYHSTAMALIKLTENISNALEKGEFVLGVFLDFSKAFDTVNFNILFKKLSLLGIRAIALNLIRSYLKNRKQYVVYNGSKSCEANITCGVPQGAILGPLLFSLYINDIAAVSNKFFPLLFADDTNVFINKTNLHDCIETMNEELKKLVVWLQCNRLSLNIKKTHYIIFKTKNKITPQIITSPCINNEPIQQVTQTKFLGVIIDHQMNWYKHIQFVQNKVAKGIGIINKARHLICHQLLKTLYYSFVYPYLNYCIEIWGKSYVTHLQSIIVQQKKIIRWIAKAHYQAHTKDLFIKYDILPLKKIYVFKVAQLLFKYFKGKLPAILSNLYTLAEEIHSYNTRYKHFARTPAFHLNISEQTINFSGAKIWNFLVEQNIDLNCSIHSFKHRVKIILHANEVDFLWL